MEMKRLFEERESGIRNVEGQITGKRCSNHVVKTAVKFKLHIILVML